jgi:hypothetical protein
LPTTFHERTPKSDPPSVPGEVAASRGVAVLGEIHTGLLQNSTAVTSDVTRELLTLIPWTPVRTWERPIRHAVSPERLTGIDASLPSASGALTRAVGTVATEARITGGHLLQVSSRTVVVSAEQRRRLPWSHYLGRPGTLEAWGDPLPSNLVAGFLRNGTAPDELDLGGVSAHVMSEVQGAAPLDHDPPVRVSRMRLRWAAVPAADSATAARVTFILETPVLRTVMVTDVQPDLMNRVQELCQDIALHDWLLSSVVSLVDVAHIGGRERDRVLDHLQPAMEHLFPGWMPAARLTDDLRVFWDEVERRAGMERQWDAVVQRIRDQFALASVARTAWTTANEPEEGQDMSGDPDRRPPGM